MSKYSRTIKKYFCLYLVIALLSFDFYYFFIRRGVGSGYYIKKIIYPDDTILDSKTYQDLSEEYYVLNKNYGKKEVIVFLGDSITKRFNLEEYFPDLSVLNRGIFNDTSLGVINRLEININNLNIEKIFLMIGYNDLEFRMNTNIIENISNILSKTKSRKIYVQSLLPVNANRKEVNIRIHVTIDVP